MALPRSLKGTLDNKRIVTIGGGTGPFAVLYSLKNFRSHISAIVSMADSGGSSRRLMDEFGQVPFGDLRQALVALSRNGILWRDIFNYRFKSLDNTDKTIAQNGVSGHNLGNLIISALQNINNGDLFAAIQDAQELLDTAGDVIPVTLEKTSLFAELSDGRTIEGESNIDLRGEQEPESTATIKRIYLDHTTTPSNQALRAIRRANIIIIGPGDLYTSIIPNLLVQDIARAIRESEGETVYVCNLMTKHGETDRYKASDYVREINTYLGARVDRVVLNDGAFPEELLENYAKKRQYPVEVDIEKLKELTAEITIDKLTNTGSANRDYVRHDPERLIHAILAPYIVPPGSSTIAGAYE